VMYKFKATEEIGWAILTGVVIFAFQVLSDFDPATVADWETWGVAVAGGVVRAGAAAGLVALTRMVKNATSVD